MLNLCANFLDKNLSECRALEVGPGNNPNLLENNFKEVIYIDNEFEDNSPNRINKNFLNFKNPTKFDVIYERLCWHEQNKTDWDLFLQNVIHHLSPGGIFISEHAIAHKKMYFEESTLHYDSISMELIDTKKDKAIRFIPDSFFIEQTLIDKKLNILYFKIPFGTKVILERRDHQTKNTDPDLLQLIAKKEL